MKKLLFALAMVLAAPAYARTPSSEERQEKRYTVDAQPLTFFASGVSAGATTGASFGQYLDPNLIVRVTLRGGESCTDERCAYVERTAAFTAQKFLGNSLFIDGGAMIQRNTFHPEDKNAFSGDKRKYHFTYNVETWGGTFALGNQWQWGNFTLGARWIAISQPLLSRQAKVHADDPDQYQTGSEEKDQLRELEDETKFYFASIALGSSF